MAGQTNIVVDGQSEIALVKSIIDYISKRLNGSPSDELKKEFIKWLKGHDLASCNQTIVKKQVAEDIEKKLTEAKIPYMTMNTPVGIMFMTKGTDKERFLQIQHDVLCMRPEFYAACSVEQSLRRVKQENAQEMALIRVGTQAEAEELIARINQEGKGIVASMCHDPDRGPTGYDVLINTKDAIKKNGADVVRLELQWALKQSNRDINDFRSEQALYDLNEMKIMLSELGKGHGISIIDQMNTSNLRVDITPNGATFKQRGQYGGWNEVRTIPDDNDFEMPIFDPNNPLYHTEDNKSRLTQFEMALRAGIKDIHNMRVVGIENAERLCNRTLQQAAEDTKKIDALEGNQWQYGIEAYENYQLDSTLNPNRRTRPDFNRNSNASAEQKKSYTIYKAQGEAMVEAINEEAHRQAGLIPGFDIMGPEKQRLALVNLTAEILEKRELPAITEFLHMSNASGVDTKTWYDNLINNFKDQIEQDGITVEFIKVRDIEGQPNRFRDYLVETKEAEIKGREAAERAEKEKLAEREAADD